MPVSAGGVRIHRIQQGWTKTAVPMKKNAPSSTSPIGIDNSSHPTRKLKQ